MAVVVGCAGNQVRTGMALEIDGKIYRVTKNQHVKPGKGGAYVQVRYSSSALGALDADGSANGLGVG